MFFRNFKKKSVPQKWLMVSKSWLNSCHVCMNKARKKYISAQGFPTVPSLFFRPTLISISLTRLGSEEIFCLFFILISFQALSRVFWKFFIWPPGAFRWIFWHVRIVSDQVQDEDTERHFFGILISTRLTLVLLRAVSLKYSFD